MRLVFIDDSEQRKPARQGLGNLIAVGAVMVPDDQLAAYARRLAEIRVDLGVPDAEEIKWNPPKGKTQDDIGALIADQPGGGAKEGRQWLTATLQFTENGTKHVDPEGVVMPIVTAPSDHVPHLQLADLITAATTAAIAGRASALELLESLKQVAHARPGSGERGGVGIVLWPPALYDLYWWLLGESHHRHHSGDTPLGPHARSPKTDPRRPFLLHDGMNGGPRSV